MIVVFYAIVHVLQFLASALHLYLRKEDGMKRREEDRKGEKRRSERRRRNNASMFNVC
jgi:hypothetical protein